MQQRTRIYFDNAATTPLSDVARAAFQESSTRWGNASSPYEAGRTARMIIDRARGEVARLVGAQTDEIVFTSGGTESNNWALLGIALKNLDNRGHFIVSAVEHHAILEPVETLREMGFEVSVAPVNCDGIVEPQTLKNLMRDNTLLVSVMQVNNETGVLQPIRELSDVARERGALFHSDAVQAIGKVAVDAGELGVDLMSLSAHKFGGSKGAGALFIRRGVQMQALLRGGGQERGRRAGTENVAAVAAMGAASKDARECFEKNVAQLNDLRERFEAGLRALDYAQINAENTPRAPHIVNVQLQNVRAESLAMKLDLSGVAVGTGSACASGALEPSHVLAAMGKTRDQARSALRVSFGVHNTLEEVDELLEVLGKS
ncbi:MAG TPA: cysteine desulfurase family protein [Abditibacteriaceae bacterium]|nr:cysteine desulfurase family protein [Abditibacteriaceae bacterium]